jgi:folate-binding protein YgfZ
MMTALTAMFVVPLTRDVIVATGKDTRSFLHSQVSNDIVSLPVGGSRYAFVLEPTGKLSAFLRVRCVADDHFVLDVDAGCGAAALARLNKFKIRVQCEFALSTETITAIRGLGPEARTEWCARPHAVAAWREADGAVDVFVSPEVTIVQDDEKYLRERVRCAWPIFGVDIDESSLPAETGLADVAVSFTKGCYPGQELVERMDSRGSTAPRRLMRLPAQVELSAARAVVGEPYRVAGVDLGRCTSVAGDYALVLVSRSHLNQAEVLQTL